MKIVKSFEDSGLLKKGITQTDGNETKEKKGGFLGTKGASLLGNILAGKGVNRAGEGVRGSGEVARRLRVRRAGTGSFKK